MTEYHRGKGRRVKTPKFPRETTIPFAPSYLKVNVNVISKDVHSEELAGADLAGVLLIPVGQKMFVHITPAGEHLGTQRPLMWTRVGAPKVFLPSGALTLLQMGQGDGSFRYLVPSSPFASRSSFFICFGPKGRHGVWPGLQGSLALENVQLCSRVTHRHRASCGAPA